MQYNFSPRKKTKHTKKNITYFICLLACHMFIKLHLKTVNMQMYH